MSTVQKSYSDTAAAVQRRIAARDKSGLTDSVGADRSTHGTVIEYGAREMMKGKSPAAAAKATAKKLSGAANAFLGSPTEPVYIDPAALEDALWTRLVEFTTKALGSYKQGKEHWAIDSTVQHFKQSPKIREALKKRIVAALGQLDRPRERAVLVDGSAAPDTRAEVKAIENSTDRLDPEVL